MKTALAVASTSLHLLYIAEWCHAHDVSSLEVVVLLKRETDRFQLEQVIRELGYKDVQWVELLRPRHGRFIALYEALYASRLGFNKRNFNYGVFADYGRSLLANVSCEQYYWLGDGTKIIHETSLASKKDFNRFRRQKLVEPIVRALLRRNLMLPEDPIIFSPFNLDLKDYEKNNFSWLKGRYSYSPSRQDLSQVYFFGSYFSERQGRPILSDNDYLECMVFIVSYFEERGLSVCYIPHRHESAEKLSRISKIGACEIVRFDYPAELEFLRRGYFPTHVASFFSTCLFHFSVMGVCKSITSFYVDFGSTNPKYSKVADTIYMALRSQIGEKSVVDLGRIGVSE